MSRMRHLSSFSNSTRDQHEKQEEVVEASLECDEHSEASYLEDAIDWLN